MQVQYSLDSMMTKLASGIDGSLVEWRVNMVYSLFITLIKDFKKENLPKQRNQTMVGVKHHLAMNYVNLTQYRIEGISKALSSHCCVILKSQ